MKLSAFANKTVKYLKLWADKRFWSDDEMSLAAGNEYTIDFQKLCETNNDIEEFMAARFMYRGTLAQLRLSSLHNFGKTCSPMELAVEMAPTDEILEDLTVTKMIELGLMSDPVGNN